MFGPASIQSISNLNLAVARNIEQSTQPTHPHNLISMAQDYSSSSDESYREGSDSEVDGPGVGKLLKGGLLSADNPESAIKSSATLKQTPLIQQSEIEEDISDIPTIEKSTLNELLLSVQNLGTFGSTGEFIRSQDCFFWLGDILRVLSKDDIESRPVHELLCSWNVLPKYFIPLLKMSKDDDDLILTMLKIFSLLTTVRDVNL